MVNGKGKVMSALIKILAKASAPMTRAQLSAKLKVKNVPTARLRDLGQIVESREGKHYLYSLPSTEAQAQEAQTQKAALRQKRRYRKRGSKALARVNVAALEIQTCKGRVSFPIDTQTEVPLFDLTLDRQRAIVWAGAQSAYYAGYRDALLAIDKTIQLS